MFIRISSTGKSKHGPVTQSAIRASAVLFSPYKVEFPIHTMYSVTIMDSIYSEGMLGKFGKAVSKSRGRGHLTKQETKTIHGQNVEGANIFYSFLQ